MVLDNAFVSVGGTDISAYIKKVAVKPKYEAIAGNRMGHTSKVNEAGLQEWVVSLTIKNDFGVGLVDSILWSLFIAKAAFTVIVRPTTSAVGTSNPNFTGSSVMLEYSPIDAEHGQQVEATVSLECAGLMSRATA